VDLAASERVAGPDRGCKQPGEQKHIQPQWRTHHDEILPISCAATRSPERGHCIWPWIPHALDRALLTGTRGPGLDTRFSYMYSIRFGGILPLGSWLGLPDSAGTVSLRGLRAVSARG